VGPDDALLIEPDYTLKTSYTGFLEQVFRNEQVRRDIRNRPGPGVGPLMRARRGVSADGLHPIPPQKPAAALVLYKARVGISSPRLLVCPVDALPPPNNGLAHLRELPTEPR
jgi:hypothetical protein